MRAVARSSLEEKRRIQALVRLVNVTLRQFLPLKITSATTPARTCARSQLVTDDERGRERLCEVRGGECDGVCAKAF